MSKWEKVKLGEIGVIITGNTPKTSDKENYSSKDISFYKPSDIAENNVSYLNISEAYVSEVARSKVRILPKGSILVTCIGIIGKIGILEHEATCNQQINAIIPDQDICLNRYIAYSIFYNRDKLRDIANAPVVPIVNKTQFSNMIIPLPPLEEQRRIADILDKASNLIALRKQQLEKMDLLIKSKFIDMFGDSVTNLKGWEKGTIRDVVSDVKYGTSAPSAENGKYIYLRMNNITYDGHLDLSSIKNINVSDNEFEKYVVRKGDILFNRTNSKELVGKTCVFKEDIDMIIAGYIIRVRANEKANAEYLSAVLNSKYGKNTLFDMCKAIVGQANINAQELQNIKILIPPIELQNQFAEFVEKVEKQKAVMQKSLEKMEMNYKALMQEYFG
ncbi:hypothetical protein SDC9_74421 [bioreactor metagenome]|uniref:Type I restriction modification DNA specificity domain-containing protein n=1 Tax=bioreactor metagenome TaxID=1076179 RepID=A0A644YHD5_9ZZZZ